MSLRNALVFTRFSGSNINLIKLNIFNKTMENIIFINHLETLFNIFLRLLAETAGLVPSEPISNVFRRMGIFYLFDRCRSLPFDSQFWMFDMLFGLTEFEFIGVLYFLRSFSHVIWFIPNIPSFVCSFLRPVF